MKMTLVSKLVTTTGIVALGMNGALHAQEVEEEASVQDVIVVTGKRASVERSTEIKRNATEFVDAISAEEVGKLPDRNIAEALQRVTGVTIQRNRGEGDFVSIRGLPPEFVRGTVNGRTFLSGTEAFDSTREGGAASTTGRATNFDILPSELIQTLEVKKSASAKDVEGGIGGTVNLETARPMTLGTSVVGVARGRYSEFADEIDPSVFVLGSWTNNDNFGILGGLNFTDRTIRQDIANNFFAYYPFGAIGGLPGAIALDLDADGVADASQPFINLSINPEIFQEERERVTANSTLQWIASPDTEVVLDVLYSERDVDTLQYGVVVEDNSTSNICVGPTTVAPDGTTLFQCPSAVVQNDTLVSRDVDGTINALFTDGAVGAEETINLGLNVAHNISDKLLAEFDVSYADTSGELNFTRSVFNLGQSFPGTLQYTENGGALVPTGGVPAALSDSASYNIRQTELRNRFNDDRESAAKIDFTYDVDGAGISAVKFGVHYREREKGFAQFLGGDGARTDILVPLDSIPNAFVRAPGDFLDGDYAGVSPSDLLFPNLDVVVPARAAGFAITPTLETSTTFDTEVETLAAYLQVDLDTQVGPWPLTGNFGVRVVDTQTNVVGLLQDFDIVERAGGPSAGGFNEVVFTGTTSDFPVSHDYLNFLPSLNLKLDITDEVVGRFSYGRTITRPEFEALAPALSVTNPSNFFASAGNPTLDPFVSDNLDFSLEWYFDQGSALTVAVFHKEISDFIVDGIGTNIDVSNIGFVDAGGMRTQGVTLASVERQQNDGEASLSGVEIGYTQFYDFLPAPWNGLGAQANLTLVDSDLENASTGVQQAFLGVSDVSYNLAGFYENGPFEARLAYTWRDSFLNDEATPLGFTERYTDEYGQLDFSASFDLNDNISFFLDGVNLTDEIEREIAADIGAGSPNASRVVTAARVGRRFSFGARAKF